MSVSVVTWALLAFLGSTISVRLCKGRKLLAITEVAIDAAVGFVGSVGAGIIYAVFLSAVDFEAQPAYALVVGLAAVIVANLDVVRNFVG